jgi:Vacuolar sorting protein 9 (VPS9) domain
LTNPSSSALEHAIDVMEHGDGLCLHPLHYHSFQTNGNAIVETFRSFYHRNHDTSNDCVICGEAFSSMTTRFIPRMFSSASSSNTTKHNEPTLKCLACGALAHRSCAMVDSPSQSSKKLMKSDLCPVNAPKIVSLRRKRTTESPAENIAKSTLDDRSSNSVPEVVSTAVPPSFLDASTDSIEKDCRSQRTEVPDPKLNSTNGKRRTVSSYPGVRVRPLETTSNGSHHDDVAAQKAVGDTKQPTNPNLFQSVQQNVSVTAVAGGIAGGIAGLALIGPAGAAYACYVSAGGLNVLLGLEGAATLSVICAGIATGGITGQQIQSHIDGTQRRVLTMASSENDRKVLLVRPNIPIDPVWEGIRAEATRSAPPHRAKSKARDGDADIVATTEEEMNTSDKVLLLVSRMLNDKCSLPGHVYRYLVETFMDRCRATPPPSVRARRDDAHAVIHHVTATVLEERVELASASTFIQELTASAVEGIVFGQLYDAVMEEISQETMEQDVGLFRKMTTLWNEHNESCRQQQTHLVSELALNALQMIPQARSVGDKLHFCGDFMEAISEHYSRRTDRSICADTLIRMVCQHVIWSDNIGNLYAQMIFLEEFARDEQLVRGRDGYALVTIQAALLVLKDSSDLFLDIFQDEDETNVLDEGGYVDSGSAPNVPSSGSDLADFDCNT